jgi:hypothetical protein
MDLPITIEKVKSMTEPTTNFLVKLENNIYGIRFKGFKIRDIDSGEIYQDFIAEDIYQLDYYADHDLIYRFPQRMLKAKNLGSNLTLVVGENVVNDLFLIERHYINYNLAANYEFYFPLFMPNSENNIEFMYPIPKLNDETRKLLDYGEDIYAKSDTFIFVENRLVIHRRAKYTYYN